MDCFLIEILPEALVIVIFFELLVRYKMSFLMFNKGFYCTIYLFVLLWTKLRFQYNNSIFSSHHPLQYVLCTCQYHKSAMDSNIPYHLHQYLCSVNKTHEYDKILILFACPSIEFKKNE